MHKPRVTMEFQGVIYRWVYSRKPVLCERCTCYRMCVKKLPSVPCLSSSYRGYWVVDKPKKKDILKVLDENQYETIEVDLNPWLTSNSWKAKHKELVDSGLSKKEAEHILKSPIELELYYEQGQGLFAVESEAIETEKVRSPYSGKVLVLKDTKAKPKKGK